MITLKRLFLIVCFSAIGLVVPGAVGAGGAVTQPLVGTVGTPTSPNNFVIALKDSAGAQVTHLDPGNYTIVVHDYATIHNFDLHGPGVNRATDVEGTGDATWQVTITDGTYVYNCDSHPDLKGSFTAGTVTTPPPPPPPAKAKRLIAQVGPNRTISLKTASGARAKRVKAGKYKLTVKDLTKADNFHLIAPGANRKTGVASRATTTWTVTLRPGAGKYRSDAHPTLRGRFTVVRSG